MRLKKAGKTVAKKVIREQITSKDAATNALIERVSDTNTGIGEIREAAKTWIAKKPERAVKASLVETDAMRYLMS